MFSYHLVFMYYYYYYCVIIITIIISSITIIITMITVIIIKYARWYRGERLVISSIACGKLSLLLGFSGTLKPAVDRNC